MGRYVDFFCIKFQAQPVKIIVRGANVAVALTKTVTAFISKAAKFIGKPTYNGVTNPTFAYDDNGNMISGGGRTIGYTSYNMASQIAQGTTGLGLAYGAWHGRYKMCVPNCTSPTTTTYYLYDPATGGMSEKVVAGSSVTWRDYIVVPGGGIVALRTYDGTTTSWRYAVADHLGSISAVTDSAGPPPNIERDSYDAWGLRRNANGTAAACGTITSQTTRGYTSQEMLDSVCLINMNARVYDPSLGRFESADSRRAEPRLWTNPLNYLHNSYTGKMRVKLPKNINQIFLAIFPQGEGGTHSAAFAAFFASSS